MEYTSDQIQYLGEQVVGFITRYLTTMPEEAVMPEGLTPERLRALLAEPLPKQPQGIDQALSDFETKVAANSARIGHPLFLGWTRASPLAVAIYAEALAATLNQSVAVWDGAPAATEVELRVIQWLKEMSGFSPHAAGLLTSGGSMANFICLLAARSALDPEVREEGLAGKPPMTLYLTEETHYCVVKAAEMMGLGRKYIRRIALNGALRMDPAALAEAILADRQSDMRPMAVVATLGTVSTGACDDLLALSRVCRELGVWLHVDGAYGGLAALVPEKRLLSTGLEQADSMVFDPHKGLYMPFEAGCALVQNPENLRAAFAVVSDYLPNTEPEDLDILSSSSPYHFRDFGPQLSRNFRALKIYLALKAYGSDTIAAALGHEYQLAAELAGRIQAAEDFELLAPVSLGVVAFRYRGRMRYREMDEDQLDALNAHMAGEIQKRRHVFLAGTRIQGRFALRVCFASFRTTQNDLDTILEEVRAVGRAA